MAYKGNFDELLKEKGLVVVEEGMAGDPGCALLDVIYNRRTIIVPWLAKAGLFICRHMKDIKNSRFISKIDGQKGNELLGFLERLKEERLIHNYMHYGSDVLVAFPEDRERLLFFRSKWAEKTFKRLVKRVVRHYLHQTNQKIPYLLRHNVKVAAVAERKRVLSEIDLLLEIGDRVYVFEVKSGPWVRILQWARKEILFVGPHSRVITCTTYPGIPAEIFIPQILLTMDSFESSFIKILETDLNVKTPTTLSKEALWEAHEKQSLGMEEDYFDAYTDSRPLARQLDEDIFHIHGTGGGYDCHLIEGDDGDLYADYNLNEYYD